MSKPKRAGGGVEVGAVDEESHTLVLVKIAFHGGYPFEEYAQRERKKLCNYGSKVTHTLLTTC